MTKPWKHNCKERGELSKRRGGAGSFEAMTSKTMIKWAALKRTQKKKKDGAFDYGFKDWVLLWQLGPVPPW